MLATNYVNKKVAVTMPITHYVNKNEAVTMLITNYVKKEGAARQRARPVEVERNEG